MKLRGWALVLLCALLIALTACNGNNTNKYEHGLITLTPKPTKAPTGAVENPGEDVTAIPTAPETEPTVEATPTETEAVPTEAEPTKAATNTPIPTSTPTPTPVPTNTPTPTTKPTNTPTPTKAVTSTPEPTKPVSAGPNRTPGKAGQYTIVLDPGHGGKWPGAVGTTANGIKLQESILSLKIANYCKAYLEAYYPEIKVVMTRTDENALASDLTKDLKLRNQVAVDAKADALVSLHLNASGTGDASGCLVCTPHRAVVKDKAVKLSSAILDQLEAIGLKTRNMSSGVRSGVYFRKSENGTRDANGNLVEYYAICRNAADVGMIGIIVEHCYIDSKSDQRFLESESALRALGEADARGIAAYFGLE